MQRFPLLRDGPGVLRRRVLLPAVGHGLQQGQQGHRGGGQHALLHGVLQQVRVPFEGRAQAGVVGNEHHHHFRGAIRGAVEFLPVPFVAQFAYAVANGLGVFPELDLAPLALGALHGVQVVLHGGLGVHRQDPPVRETDDHVGAAAVRGRLLFLEIDVGDHVGHLHHPAELQLAPAAPRRGRRPQGVGQRRQLAQPFLESLVGALALLLHLLHLEVQLAHALAEWVHEVAQLFLVSAPVAPHLGEQAPHLFPRLLQEPVGVVLERPGGQRLEHFPQLLLRRLHPAELLRFRLPLLGGLRDLDLHALMRRPGVPKLVLQTLDPVRPLLGPGPGLRELADLGLCGLDPLPFPADLVLPRRQLAGHCGMPRPGGHPGQDHARGKPQRKVEELHQRHASQRSRAHAYRRRRPPVRPRMRWTRSSSPWSRTCKRACPGRRRIISRVLAMRSDVAG